MPPRSGSRSFNQDVPFPVGGLVESQPVEDQLPGTTIDAENVRAYPANLNVTKASASLNATFNGRNRGGQRSGLSSHLTQISDGNTVNLPFPDSNHPPIQDITHLTWSEVTDLFGEGHIIQRNTSSGSFHMLDKDGVAIGTGGNMGDATERFQQSTWGSDGSAYVAVTTADNDVAIRRLNTNVDPATNQPDILWTTASLPNSLIPIKSAAKAYKPVRGMGVWADTLYVWIGSLNIDGNTATEAIYRFDTSTGVLRDGKGNNRYWIRNFGGASTGAFHATDIADTHYAYNNLMALGRNRMALLTFNGQGGDTGANNISTGLAHTVGAVGMRTALESLSGISSGDVTTTLGHLASPKGILVEFTGAMAKRNVPPLEIDATGAAQVFTITCALDTGDPGYNGRYFNIYDASNNKYTIWFKTGRTEVGVAAAGLTSLYKATKVTIATGAANTVVAAAIQTAIDAESAFTATVASNVVTVTNAAAGDSTDPSLGDVNTDTAFLAVAVDPQGVTGLQAADEVQQARLKGAPQYGTVTASFEHGGGTQTTGVLAYDATAAKVQTALEALSNVVATANNKWSLYTPDDDDEHAYIMIVAEATTITADINNVQTTLDVAATSGDRYDLAKYYGHTSGTGQIRQIIIDDEIMEVTGISGTTLTVTRAQTGSWGDGPASVAQPHSSGAVVYHRQVTAGGMDSANSASDMKVHLEYVPGDDGMNFFRGGGQNQKQTVKIDNASAGTFKLEFRGKRTATILYNETKTNLNTKLEAVSTVGSGNITATGDNFDSSGGDMVLEFTDDLGNENHPLLRIVEESADFDAATKTVTQSREGWLDDLTVTGTSMGTSSAGLTIEFGGYWAGKTIKYLSHYNGNSGDPWEDSTAAVVQAASDGDVSVTGGWDIPSAKEHDLSGSLTDSATSVTLAIAATATVTITDYTELNSGDKVNLIATDGTNYDFTNGDQSSVAGTWAADASNNQTATNLAAVINTSSGPSGTRFSAAAAGAVVTITQSTDGADGNTTVTITDSGTAGMTKTNFAGGRAVDMKGNDVIKVGLEFMLVTDASSNPITVTRGYAGTEAVAHSDGDDVFLKRTDLNINWRGSKAGTLLNKITFVDSGLTVAADTEVKNVKVTAGAAASSSVTIVQHGSTNYNEFQKLNVTGGGGNVRIAFNAETVLQILDLDTADTISTTTLQLYGTTTNNGYEVISDRFGDFYTVSYVNALLAGGGQFATCKVTNAGVRSWIITGSGITRGLAYDNLNDRLAVVGKDAAGTKGSFVLLNPTNGAVTHTLYPYEDSIDPDEGVPYNITQWHNVNADHLGGFTLLRNSSTDNVARMTSASTPLEESILSAGSSPAWGASVASVMALNPENSLAVRQIQSFAIAGGTIKEFRAKAQYQAQAVDTWVDITGGDLAFRGDTPIFSTQLGQDIFFADGTSTKYYDASAAAIVTWTPSAGSLPVDSNSNRARLICTYRGRIVLSGVKGDPTDFYMSAVGNALDWDYGVVPQTETMAVAGGASPAGKMPDKINTLIPMTDNILIVGCDHTVFAIMGDIAAEGGRINLLSDEIGLAWGQDAWCKDPYGQFYAFGSRGGVYAGRVQGEVVKITTPSVEERMATTIDLNKHLIRMIWNEREHGFHLFVTPLQFGVNSSTPEKQTHYFYDARNKSWWIDTFANNNHQPYSVHTFDGDDPGDRVILLGCQDGIIRKWDIDSPTDGNVYGDTTNISSHIYLGPFRTGGPTNLLLEEMQATIAAGSGTVDYDIYVGDSSTDAYNRSNSRFTGSWVAGRNKSERRRAQGREMYLKLSNTDETSWAIENLMCRYREVMGPAARRAT